MKSTLTLDNYFTPENKYITNSKLSDYVKSPNYFYRKHVLFEIIQKPTGAMVLGSGIDYLLAQDDKKPTYVVVERRNLKNPPIGVIEVNQSQYNDIIDIANAVEVTDIFKDIDKRFKKQVILKTDRRINKYWKGLAGIPDYILVTDDEIIIVDLKSSVTTDARKYYYHCRDFRYFHQQGLYQMLASENYPGRKKISSYHLVVDKQKDIYNVVLFKLDQQEINNAKYELLQTIEELSQCDNWDRPNVNWNSAVELHNPNTEELFESLTDDIDPESDNSEF